MSKVNGYTFITGATGFVGGAITERLRTLEYGPLRVCIRSAGYSIPGVETAQVPDLAADTDWQAALQEVDVVVHAAARVHVMAEDSNNPLREFRAVNVAGTLNLARQAAAAGVKRFLFISSIKVNGEDTVPGQAFRYDDAPAPKDAYGQSKAEAEVALQMLAKETGLEVVIIRPPLVYGPGVKANFAAMMGLARKNLPLPLGAVYNKRSLVALDNLIDLIVTCLDHPDAANQTFLVSDRADVSTTELLALMTRAAGHTPRLLSVPVTWLQMGARILGKKAIADRLFGSLQVDISHTCETLQWQPPLAVEDGIRRCFDARSYDKSLQE